MADTTKAEWIALLKLQLEQATEREQRWKQLGEQLHTARQETWQAIADMRHAEVEQLTVLIQEAEEKHP